MKILVVDLETTGLYPKWDIIVEIGIALVDTETKKIDLLFDEVVKHWKFNGDKMKNSWVFKNTSLTVEDVEAANSLKYYQTEIQNLFDTYPMTAYNKQFDIRFLTAAGFKMNDVKCLMKTAKTYSKLKNKYGGVKTPSVEEIYNQFFMKDGEVYVEEHRAGSDALDEAKILLHMVDLKDKRKKVITE